MTDLTPFTIYWHRQGNAPAGVEAVHRARREGPETIGGRPLRHGVELDLKWARDGKDLLLYAWHGPTGRERLAATTVRQRATRGELMLIDTMVEDAGASGISCLVEIKTGDGPCRDAIGRLASSFERRSPLERLAIASSSLAHLEDAAAVAPRVERVLFTPLVTRGARALHVAPTDLARALRRGIAPRLAGLGVGVVCVVPMRPRGLAFHAARARRAAAGGLGYLPGRVDSMGAVAALAAEGIAGAFAYFPPALATAKGQLWASE